MAVLTDQLAAEHAQVRGGFAKHAASFELAKEHAIALDSHIEQVTLPDAKNLTEFGRNHDATEMINLAGDALGALVRKRFVGGTCHAPNVEGSDTLCRTFSR
jgi:hypothetical protein